MYIGGKTKRCLYLGKEGGKKVKVYQRYPKLTLGMIRSIYLIKQE